MTLEETYINEVVGRIPHGPRRAQIEMDLHAHIAERLERGEPLDAAIRQFGDPDELAESYLASVPLVSASFFTRAAAKLIDFGVIVAIVCAVAWSAWWLLGPQGIGVHAAGDETRRTVFLLVCATTLVVLCPGYFIVAEYLTDQTLGKRALGVRVVRESGARISLGQSFVRQLPLMAQIFILDVLFALFTEKSQRAFELISKTRVVHVEDEFA